MIHNRASTLNKKLTPGTMVYIEHPCYPPMIGRLLYNSGRPGQWGIWTVTLTDGTKKQSEGRLLSFPDSQPKSQPIMLASTSDQSIHHIDPIKRKSPKNMFKTLLEKLKRKPRYTEEDIQRSIASAYSDGLRDGAARQPFSSGYWLSDFAKQASQPAVDSLLAGNLDRWLYTEYCISDETLAGHRKALRQIATIQYDAVEKHQDLAYARNSDPLEMTRQLGSALDAISDIILDFDETLYDEPDDSDDQTLINNAQH